MDNLLTAARACEIRGAATEALHLYWLCVRSALFAWLDQRGVSYCSTETALLEFFKETQTTEYPSQVMSLYHLSILAEYYPQNLEKEVSDKYVAAAKHILKFVAPSIEATLSDRDLVLQEINEHINDCKWNTEQHFFAARRLQNIQNWIVKYPLVFLSAVTAFLTVGSLNQASEYLKISKPILEAGIEILSLAVVVLTGLNAASNMEQRAEKHRGVANKYITIKRNARHLRLEVERCRDDFILTYVIPEKLSGIKDMLNNAAQDAPQLPASAFRHTKKIFGEETL